MEDKTKQLVNQLNREFGLFPFGGSVRIDHFNSDATNINAVLEATIANMGRLRGAINGYYERTDAQLREFSELRRDVEGLRRLLGIGALADALQESLPKRTAPSTVNFGQMPTLFMQKFHGYLANSSVIEAIKCVRAYTGCGLKEAKEFVDRVRGL